MSHPLARSFARCTDGQAAVDWLLHHGADITRAGCGNVQLMSWTRGHLEIKAQLGLDDDFLKFFKQVKLDDRCACARALRSRDPVIVEDVMADEDFRPYRDIFGQAGIRAVQSTPLISTSGALVGVLSTHFPAPHRPTDVEMLELRRAARLAADAVIHFRARVQSSVDAINQSMRLMQQSRAVMDFADGLLSNVGQPRRR